jgi:hypothetical protein
MEEEKRESLFLVSIIGRNINFEVPVNSMNDFENVENILRTLKKKL